MKFNLNLVNLSFLGEELYTTNINFYPIIIFEFMKGYYTTKELYEKNNILINANLTKKLNSDSIENNLKIDNSIKESKKVEREKRKESANSERTASISLSSSVISRNIDLKLEDEQTANTNKSKKREGGRSSSFAEIQDSEININKEKTNKNKINFKNKVKSEVLEIKEKKTNYYNFVQYFDVYLEKILYFRDGINKKQEPNKINIQTENLGTMIEMYKRKERINKIKIEIEYYKSKNEEIKKIKEKLQKIISNKKNILSNLSEKITSYKDHLTNLEQTNKESLSLLAQQKMLYNSFLNKKMAEICFFFFNKKIKNLYFIDDSLKINIENDNESVKKRFEYYNSNKKRISSMMGYITQLMIYMSKCFDIPLPFPLCLNGSKSFVVRGKKDKEKDFLPLHCDLKREDRYGNYETGLNYLKNDFNEIINFCMMFPQIISETNYNKLFKDKESNTFFYYFINFNHCLLEFVKNIQKMFE